MPRILLLSGVLGAIAGALEATVRSPSLSLHMSFGQGLALAVAVMTVMAVIAVLVALPSGWVIQKVARATDEARRISIVLSLVGLFLGAFYFLPLADQARDNHGLMLALGMAVLPFPVSGIVGKLSLYYLRREAQGQPAKVGFVLLGSVGSGILALLSAVVMSTVGYGGANAVSTDPTVVIVSIDTLRRDHLSIYGESPVETPYFDSLAEQGILFTDAVTPIPETAPAHSAMMTGLHPLDSGVLSNGHILRPGPPTLADRLADEGYATGAFVSSIAVASRTGLNRGFQVYDEDFFPWVRGFSSLTLSRILSRLAMTLGDPTDYPFLLERPAPVTFERALGWLSETADRPAFAWVHLFDPHSPYEPHGMPGFEANGTPNAPVVDHRTILTLEPGYSYTEEERRSLADLYAEEVAYTDEQLGLFVESVKSTMGDRPWILVVTSDHGEMLGEHDINFNHHGIYEDVIRIPLVMVGYGVEVRPEGSTDPISVDAQVRLMDLPRTILSIMGFEDTPMGEGKLIHELLDEPLSGGFSTVLMGRKSASLSKGTLYGARDSSVGTSNEVFKLIEDPDAGSEQLFELISDPDESVDRSSEEAEQLSYLKRMIAKKRGSGKSEEAVVDEAEKEQLEALGYIE